MDLLTTFADWDDERTNLRSSYGEDLFDGVDKDDLILGAVSSSPDHDEKGHQSAATHAATPWRGRQRTRCRSEVKGVPPASSPRQGRRIAPDRCRRRIFVNG